LPRSFIVVGVSGVRHSARQYRPQPWAAQTAPRPRPPFEQRDRESAVRMDGTGPRLEGEPARRASRCVQLDPLRRGRGGYRVEAGPAPPSRCPATVATDEKSQPASRSLLARSDSRRRVRHTTV
jgi:hypothetical protein